MTLTAAQAEAYAFADAAYEVELVALQIDEPSFTQPARIVRDHEPLTAPLPDGTEATFAPLFFQFNEPSINEDPDAVAQVTIDNLSGELTPYLLAGSKSGNPVKITALIYLVNELEGTVRLIRSLPFDMRSARDNLTSVTITAARRNPANIPFPRERYTVDRFPGL
ncbi:DUF1833 family protein [Endozoicomonas lisbonensis]|uniref:DUF1833 family protein n=1 Tax=Endozoicomonas lisbonensis TaxID=3120522 RepID=UPI003390CAC4